MAETSRSALPDDAPALPAPLMTLCRLFAVLGGLVLLAMMLMTVASVTLRALANSPIPGDFELVEIGTALAVFCFLPWCQAVDGNVRVDLFTAKTGLRTRRLLGALGDTLYLGLAMLLLWRLIYGAGDMRAYGETSMILRVPLWWSFVVILPAMALLAITCAASIAGRLRRSFG
ncbi:hypothetical protein OCGS_1404 [Oceaniovalibus guishaninsula JLT2003]|uniref:TRAP transporter small permease protein n=1 Tax=Oceaniovalibus guishaninsula JLT2003 TaxID=1231392 RepID=K2GPI2_9RHOB|nr:TRAP transporter small permease [Oceaniovalibus guishaninsula]EKE44566.1 hypothetical protein OCGS_1404 [Oceaniovalibus guishaninsula JLT2003]